MPFVLDASVAACWAFDDEDHPVAAWRSRPHGRSARSEPVVVRSAQHTHRERAPRTPDGERHRDVSARTSAPPQLARGSGNIAKFCITAIKDSTKDRRKKVKQFGFEHLS